MERETPSSRHRPAGLGAFAAGGDTVIHVADALAVLGALLADFSAFAARVLVMLSADQHEVRGCSAHLRARHHQSEVSGFSVLAARVEAMAHRH